MNAHSKISRTAALFKSNRSQAVRIPKDLAFPESVKKLSVRRDGNKLILEPETTFWDDFFNRPACPDFPDRPLQGDYEVRENF
jgi:antitoxin VapB